MFRLGRDQNLAQGGDDLTAEIRGLQEPGPFVPRPPGKESFDGGEILRPLGKLQRKQVFPPYGPAESPPKLALQRGQANVLAILGPIDVIAGMLPVNGRLPRPPRSPAAYSATVMTIQARALSIIPISK